MKKSIYLLLTVLGASLLTGCNPWYLVESNYDVASIRDTPPEVVRTPAYDRVLRTALSVALRAPDKCADRSDAQTKGDARATGELLRTTCGVEMAELERALVKANYRVVSWNAIREMVTQKTGVTPLEAARGLGADVLFQVNSLEQSVSRTGSSKRWTRTFFRSNKAGRRGVAEEVPEARANALEAGMVELEKMNEQRDQVGVTINVTAVLVENGESIWFYDWTHAEQFDGSATATRLFECNRKYLFHCLVRTIPAEKPRVETTTRSGGDDAWETHAQSASESGAAYYRLVKEVMAGLVTEFSSHQP